MSAAAAASADAPALPWDHCKIFVGGIPRGTGDHELFHHFSRYGKVVEAVAIRDRATGLPRGFGFVVFSEGEALIWALADYPHVIRGKEVEVTRARPRIVQNGTNNNSIVRNQAWPKKIFVGGLPVDITQDVFKAYFEGFGTVTDVIIVYDMNTHCSRGFGFIEFELEETVDKVMQEGVHKLNNKLVEVRRAVQRSAPRAVFREGYNSRKTSPQINARNTSNYILRPGSGTGYYQGGAYPNYSPTYGASHVYPQPPPFPLFSGYAYGPSAYRGGYIRLGYGSPFSSHWSPSNGHVAGVVTQNPVPYGRATMYPGYSHGGFGSYFGVPYGGYYGMVSGYENGSLTGSDVQTTFIIGSIASQVEGLKLDAR